MERLTQTSNSGGVAFTFDLDITCQPSEARKILNLATKLKEYEDLEEQGRLIKLPCKVGDIVYEANADRNIVSEFEVISIVIYSYSIQFNWQLIDGIYKNVVGFSDFDIGKTVFLTKSEAEAKLEELRGTKNNEN